ncbi:hypothetical protein [Streptomyces sp. NPDC017435]|uniref:hypothetical protein n=1 Tax=Streptomyces sp. NPDC017435 TaxID=3364995 RepID=UPI00379F602A
MVHASIAEQVTECPLTLAGWKVAPALPAPGLTVSARAADGMVEGLELPGAPGWFTAVHQVGGVGEDDVGGLEGPACEALGVVVPG